MMAKFEAFFVIVIALLTVIETNATFGGSASQSNRFLRFVREPPEKVDFINTKEAIIPCIANGFPPPIITWQRKDGHQMENISNLAVIGLHDNALIFRPFSPELFRPELHLAIYRCIASNSLGTIVSRTVRVRAVINQRFDINVYDEYVMRNGIAIFKCQIPTFVRDFVSVVNWMRDDGNLINEAPKRGVKRFMLDGYLYVINVDREDEYHSYRCRVRHRLTDEIHLSSTSGKIIVIDPTINVHPRITSGHKDVEISAGETAYFACVAQGFPMPTYKWYRKIDAYRQMPISADGFYIEELQKIGVLIINNVSQLDQGTYICLANNTVGEVQLVSELMVREPFSVSLTATNSESRLEIGKTISLNCSISGFPVKSIVWTKDYKPIVFNARVKLSSISKSHQVLHVSSVKRSDQGCYQCFVGGRDDDEQLQSSACLHVTEEVPRLKTTFSQQILRPNDALSLRCVASGTPLPTITWTIDGYPIAENHHILYGDYVSAAGDVISYVNVSGLRNEDGGLYRCIASNAAGSVSHEDFVLIVGAPFIRDIASINVMVGETVVYRCPASGYPQPKITWYKGDKPLPLNDRYKAYDNGTILLRSVNRDTNRDVYSCSAINKHGAHPKKNLYINVLQKPIISPFIFPSNLVEGMKVIVTCNVLAGDPPIKVEWLFNGEPVNGAALNIDQQSMGDMGSVLVFRQVDQRHNGNYSCAATNKAGNTTHTQYMNVQIAPRWKIEPEANKSSVAGNTTRFDCQAEGNPTPIIRWKLSTDGKEFKSISSNYHIQSLENGSLLIKEVDKSDEAFYICEASNGIGTDLSAVVQLSVHIRPYFKSHFQVLRIMKGNPMKISCPAFGEKPLSIRWIKDDIDLLKSESNLYSITETQKPEGVVSELYNFAASRVDNGLFECVAGNAYGSATLNSQVLVEEVADSPHDFQAAEIGSRDITLKWSIPFSGNSPITKYNVEWKRDKDTWSHLHSSETSASSQPQITITDLRPLTNYNFRIYAINSLGKSEPSNTKVTTDDEVPQFAPSNILVTALSTKSLKVSWKAPQSSVNFGTIRGYYISYKLYNSNDQAIIKTTQFATNDENEYTLTELKKASRYVITLQAFNGKGAGPVSEEIVGQTLELDPPPKPRLKIYSFDSNSVTLEWGFDFDNAIQGYHLYFRNPPEDWHQHNGINPNQRIYTIGGLRCGTNYQLYLEAFNDAGTSPPSDIVSAMTRGAAPMAPEKVSLLEVNSTYVVLHLLSWKTRGCAIQRFVIKYKESGTNDWLLVSNNVLSTLDLFHIYGLHPATWYSLNVNAISDAGNTEAEYIFSTLTETGGTIAPIMTQFSDEKQSSATRHITILIPIICAAFICIVIAAIMSYIYLRSRHLRTAANLQMDSSDMKMLDSISMTDVKKSIYETPSRCDMTRANCHPGLVPYATTRLYTTTGYERINCNQQSGNQTNDANEELNAAQTLKIICHHDSPYEQLNPYPKEVSDHANC